MFRRLILGRLFIQTIMKDIYIGIDPGSKGFCCIWYGDSGHYAHYPLFEGKRLNPELVRECQSISKMGWKVMALVEQVHSMPGQGVASTFSFGTNYGIVLGMLEALGIPFSTCTPGRWQKAMCEAVDKAANTKLTSYNAARRLLPNMDFRKSERSRTYDDNKVDATLICLYAQRRQL